MNVPRPSDYRELVIEDQADRIVDLEEERDVYRSLLLRALSHAYDLNGEIKVQRKRIERLVEENRWLRTGSQPGGVRQDRVRERAGLRTVNTCRPDSPMNLEYQPATNSEPVPQGAPA
jgi:hypothetical protein